MALLRLTIFFTFLGLAPSALAELSFEEFKTLDQVARLIKSRIRADQNVILGLGRSPTPFVAYYQNIQAEYAWNLPLSDFRHSPNTSSALPTSDEAILFAHFDRYLPSPEAVRGRDIALLDFSLTGQSLRSAAAYLEKYLAARGRTERVKLVEMIINLSRYPDMYRSFARNQEVWTVKVPDSILLEKLISQSFDSYSEFGIFNVRKQFRGNDEQILSRDSKQPYLQLRKQLRDYLSSCRNILTR